MTVNIAIHDSQLFTLTFAVNSPKIETEIDKLGENHG